MDTAQEQQLRDVDAPGRLRWDTGVEHRRRRPSGEPPPLPRELRRSGRYWAILTAAVVLFWVASVVTGGAVTGPAERIDHSVLRGLEDLRNDVTTSVMRAFHALGSDWTMRLLAWPGLLVTLLFKRLRHALVFIGSLVVVNSLAVTIADLIARQRPLSVEIIGPWQGFSHPSRPVAGLAVVLLGLMYALVPQGQWRDAAKWACGGLVAALAASRLYLGIDHPTDVLVGAIMGVTIPLVAFRLLTPNEVCPVRYRRGRSAHLDVGGRRGQAIHRALEDQLGLTVKEVTPFGLAGSAGSTPLRIAVGADGEEETYLFGKLYAANHLRADRWYKLGRTLLYGRLEDEGTFSTVRRLVQYEDYMLRVMQAAGVPGPEPYGFVEITPEREYLLVTEFLVGGQELGEVEINDQVIDEALEVVHSLWDAGLAHRDIKPSNILVREGTVYVIDVAFGEIRPSPWRQAVDLANMMLTLASCTSAERVYQRALRLFTPSEIAEAFAATFRVTSPTQLRSVIKSSGRDLVADFRALAPPHPPIPIQRWSVRRVGLWLAVGLGALLALAATFSGLQNARLL